MKSFFKTVLAVVVGILALQLVKGIMLFIWVASFVAILSGVPETVVKDHSVLTINTSTVIQDRVSNDPMESLQQGLLGGDMHSALAMYDVLRSVRAAASDERVDGIVILGDGVGFSRNIADELRRELIQFKESGKFIYAFSEGFTSSSYFLSSVADSVFLHPMGMLEWKGFSSSLTYMKSACDKFGIEPHVVRHGKYKSAVEPFLEDRMSAANREQTTEFLLSMWNYITAQVAESRGVESAELNRVADELVMVNPEDAIRLRMVDGILYRDQLDSLLLAKTQLVDEKMPNLLALADYLPMALKEERKLSSGGAKLAVVYAEGDIKDSKNVSKEVGGEGYAQVFADLRRDSSIKAVVLRINSPGGSALASETMWRELHLLKAVKPLIVSMGTYAASGGYYIAAPGDYIVANPLTITGSIGVFGLFFTFQKLASQTLALNMETVRTHAYSDLGNLFRPLAEHEREILQRAIESTYTTFLERVAEGRGMTPSRVDSIAQGRVWSGEAALPRGLVDEFGGLERAIEVAAERAGLEDYRLVSYPKSERNPVMELLLGAVSGKVELASHLLPPVDQLARELEDLRGRQGVRAELPVRFDIR